MSSQKRNPTCPHSLTRLCGKGQTAFWKWWPINAEQACGRSSSACPKAKPSPPQGDRFEELWADLRTWGSVLFIVHTDDIVLECEGALPSGTSGHGYFNIHGDSPIGGHIKASNCTRIAFVDRPFHGRRSCSVQFLNATGNAMFKIFVRRDESHELLSDQVKLFEIMRENSDQCRFLSSTSS